MKTTKPSNTRWLALTALCIAVFMSLLDSTIVNVALPTVQKELNESYTDLQWVINAYTLAFAMCLLLAAKFGDLFGRKKVFLISLIIFTVGSLGSALSFVSWQLNLARVVQGIGGAGMMSLSMTIVAETFVEEERGIAFGIWSSVVGVATALGPVLGGFLIKIFSWRTIFSINIPIGLIALYMAFAYIDETYGARNQKIDWAGMVISTVMIFCLVFGLVQKENNPDLSWANLQISGYLVVAVTLLILFVMLESRIKEPMVNLAIFRSWTFNGTVIASFCLGAGLYAFFTYLTIWMQNHLNYTAEQTGIRQLAIGLISLVLGPVAGWLSNRFAKRWLIGGGLLLIAAGLFEIYSVVSLQTTYLNFVAGFIILGIGNAIVNPPLSAAAMAGVKLEHVGIASGVVNVFRQLGSTFGVVILGLQLSHGYHNEIGNAIQTVQVPKVFRIWLVNALQNAGPVGSNEVIQRASGWINRVSANVDVISQLKQATFVAFNVGYRRILITSIGIALFGAIIAVLTIREKNTSNSN